MKLHWSPRSPFVRKVMVFAHETGLAPKIERVRSVVAMTKPNAALMQDNPLSKIPTLVTDDGTILYDSDVICEYLDSLGGGRLIPATGEERWRVLRQQALTDGILDAAILLFYERAQRPAEFHWQPWLDGQAEKARQGLAALETEVASFPEPVDLAQIAAGITLGWLEFRAPLGDLRATHPRLFAWYDRFRERPSMKATEPHA